jgi:hypothetical protein
MSLRIVDLIGGFSNSVETIRNPRIGVDTRCRSQKTRIEIRSGLFVKFYPAGAV